MRTYHFLQALFLSAIFCPVSFCLAQPAIDTGTQRNGMHSCPIGQFVLGVQAEKNYLLCAPLPGNPVTEIVDRGTQERGMHACPMGMAMTGLQVADNLLACTQLTSPPPARFVDTNTQKMGMHACPGNNPGDPVVGVQVAKNLLLCAGAQIAFPFNLEWQTLDPNGLPLNPIWAWQRQYPGEIPWTSLCHNFSKEVTTTVNGSTFNVRVPDFADCTNQTDPSRIDTPDGFNELTCSFGESDSFRGHLNWFAVTIDGTLAWEDHAFDDDYDLGTYVRGNGLMVNGRDNIHAEFDSDETIDHFGIKWWKDFHSTVDASMAAKAEIAECGNLCGPDILANLKKAADAPRVVLNASTEAVVTGMFGFDCEHDCKAELHPVYALAAKVQDKPDDEIWAMFVRNVGDEGWCSSHLWSVPLTSYTFRLPWRAGMQSVQVLWGLGNSQFEGTAGTTGPVISFDRPLRPGTGGVYIKFTLPQPTAKPLIDGVLHLKWQPAVNQPPIADNADSSRPAGSTPAVADEKDNEFDEAEERLGSLVSKLPAAQRRVFQNALASRRPAADLHVLPAGRPAREMRAMALPQTTLLAVQKVGVASRKRERDNSTARALCTTYSGALPGLPADSCGTVSNGSPH